MGDDQKNDHDTGVVFSGGETLVVEVGKVGHVGQSLVLEQMPHIPSKDAMIRAVRTSGCANLNHLPLELMTAEEVYGHLLAAKCPCLQRLLAKEKSSHP
jgi:hypothetical protein